MGFELTTLVVMETDCTGSCKSNYHTITTAQTCFSDYLYYSEHRELYSNMDMRIEYAIFLMMRLKSFRPEIDKKLAAPERMPKIK
jgi:hypothetical protein